MLPEFEKVLDIDIKAAAEAALENTDQNSVQYLTMTGIYGLPLGGFRIYPDREQQGAVGYISQCH